MVSENETRRKLIERIMTVDEKRLKQFSTDKLRQIDGLLFTREKTYEDDNRVHTIQIFNADTKDTIENKIIEKHELNLGTIYVDMLDGKSMYELLDMCVRKEGDAYDLHSESGLLCDHATASDIAEKLYAIKKEMIDKAVVSELNGLTLESQVYMTVWDKRQKYAIVKQCDGSYDMEVINDAHIPKTTGLTYGMSCDGIADIVSVLLGDYVRGIIQDLQIAK